MSYLIGKWYIETNDGQIVPCQNYRTAELMVELGYATRIVDPTRSLMSV
jgi:hypothetical protein